MKLIPAIDLLNQKCVRLYQGNFDEVTYYDLDPIELAKHYQKLGCNNLHLVDLNGSRDGVNTNTHIIDNLLNCTDLKIQMGGGIRSPEGIRKWLKSDLEQLVIGSFAIKDFSVFAECLDDDEKSRVIIALDVTIINNLPMVMIEGWQKQTDLDLWSMINKFNDNVIIIKEIHYRYEFFLLNRPYIFYPYLKMKTKWKTLSSILWKIYILY